MSVKKKEIYAFNIIFFETHAYAFLHFCYIFHRITF